VLAERLDALLDEVLRRSGGSAPVPALAPTGEHDTAPLELPIVEEFRVGTLTLAWDGERERVVVRAFALTPDDEVDDPASAGEDPDDSGEPTGDAAEPPGVPPDADVLVVVMTGTVARAFARRARAVVQAGRPPCPLCQQPLDPQGHVCPRQNGYRRRG
jgi:uncharacterized repeat protein (TIGR03847 family)